MSGDGALSKAAEWLRVGGRAVAETLGMTRGVPTLKNDRGLGQIGVGFKTFACIGESPPLDHPAIYLDMGEADAILCPYCATRFVYQRDLGPMQTAPPDCLWTP